MAARARAVYARGIGAASTALTLGSGSPDSRFGPGGFEARGAWRRTADHRRALAHRPSGLAAGAAPACRAELAHVAVVFIHRIDHPRA